MHKEYMELAIKEAKKAYNKNEIPVGCVILNNKNEVVAKAHNLKHNNKSALDHAEMLALKKCYKKYNDWRLNDHSIYITLEPCMMCYGAIINSRIKNIYIGVPANNQNFKFIKDDLNIVRGIEEKAIKEMFNRFFKNLRNNNK